MRWLKALALVGAVVGGVVADTDHYGALGLTKSASNAEIKKAYRKLSLQYHPDKNPGDAKAQELFRKVAAAFEVLGDPDKRVVYDDFGGGEKFTNRWEWEQAQRKKGKNAAAQQDFYMGNDDILKLDWRKFEQITSGTEPVLVEFYAPWCVHCQEMTGHYNKASILLDGVVRLAAVNCERERNLCQTQGIRGYPSLELFFVDKSTYERGRETFPGNIGHEPETIYTWVQNTLNTKMETITAGTFDKKVRQSDDIWLIDFSAGAWCGPCTHVKGRLRQTAGTLKDMVKVGIVNCDNNSNFCTEVMKVPHYPHLRLFRKGVTGAEGEILEMPQGMMGAPAILELLPTILKVALKQTPKPVAGDAEFDPLDTLMDEPVHDDL